MDLKTIEKSYRFHHRAWARGYQAVSQPEIIREYHGRYGDGYTIEYPSLREPVYGNFSTGYHAIDYYVK